MKTPMTFNEFCHKICDGLYDPRFPDESQCSGYTRLKQMVLDGLSPASREELQRWEENPTYEESLTVANTKYLRFLNPVLRPFIIDHWEQIKRLKID